MTAKPENTCWSYQEACRAIPYVRLLLGRMRSLYVAAWHFYRLTKNDDADHEVHEHASRCRQEALDTLHELHGLEVFVYQHPATGIALFPFIVHVCNVTLKAYFVYKDTRDSIDTFIFHVDLCQRNDLYADEKPVPSGWRHPGAIPKL